MYIMQNDLEPATTFEVRAKLSYLDQVLRTGTHRAGLVVTSWVVWLLLVPFVFFGLRGLWFPCYLLVPILLPYFIAAVATVIERKVYVIRLAEESFEIEMPGHKQPITVPWSEVVRITNRFRAMGFILKKQKLPFRYLPEAVFESPEAAQAFRAKANEYWRVARAKQHQLGTCGKDRPAKIKCVRPKDV